MEIEAVHHHHHHHHHQWTRGRNVLSTPIFVRSSLASSVISTSSSCGNSSQSSVAETRAMCLLETENSLTYQTWIKKTTNSNTKNAHPGIKHSCIEANFVGVFSLWLHRSVDPGRGILWMNHCLNLETFRANSWAPFCFMGCF